MGSAGSGLRSDSARGFEDDAASTYIAIDVKPTAKIARTTIATRWPAGAPMPFPAETMTGTLPVIAVIGAAVATAVKATRSSPIAFGSSRWTVVAPLSEPAVASGGYALGK
ncbi:hypothetical protein [Streptomyces albicerus]|uniref:hypothetical protein n=1 Tax=Streptomyces albicerus TaxID=2569859 RepID=UPI001788CCC7